MAVSGSAEIVGEAGIEALKEAQAQRRQLAKLRHVWDNLPPNDFEQEKLREQASRGRASRGCDGSLRART